MGFDQILSATNISASGLSAERLRMEVVANNIANANSTRTPEGGAYRRRDVVFSAVFNEHVRSQASMSSRLGGVRVMSIQPDRSELPLVYNPSHPDSNADGYVTMPNVKLPLEMVDLITASRAYEANLRVLQSFRQMAEQSLSLLARV